MTFAERIEIRFRLNGCDRVITTTTFAVLADVLREELGLTGTKIGCDQGVCGACTVIIDDVPTASCTEFAFMVDGRSVTTIEGLGPVNALHPIQRGFIDTAAMQCGYCTPGMILLLHALLSKNPTPSETTLRQWLGSSICRCTGYQVIIEAVRRAAQEYAHGKCVDAQ
jgi:aerobic carbon-monoxide dehydrogenase small subunit